VRTLNTKLKGYGTKSFILQLSIFIILLGLTSSLVYSFESFQNNNLNLAQVNLKSGLGGDAILSDGNYIFYDKIPIIKKGFDKVSYESEMNSTITTGSRASQIREVLTDYNYSYFNKFQFIRGSFITQEDNDKGRSRVVISETLANNLFNTIDIIGSEVKLGGATYKVLGVYKDKSSIISSLWGDGVERVYVPFESNEACSIVPIKSLMLYNGSIEYTDMKARQAEVSLNDMNIDNSSYSFKEFNHSSKLLLQDKQMLTMILTLWLLVLLIKLLIRHVASLNETFKRRIKFEAIGNIFISEKKEIGILIVFTALVLILVSVILKAKYSIYIPPEYRPTDNIFDMNFYFDKIKIILQNANGAYQYFPTEIEGNYSTCFNLATALFFCTLVSIGLVISRIKLEKLVEDSLIIYILNILIAMVLALITLLIITRLTGLYFNISLEDFGLVSVFCFVKLYYNKRI